MWADEEWSLSRLLTVAAPDRRPEAEASALRRTQQLGRDLDQHMQQLISSCVSCHGRSLSHSERQQIRQQAQRIEQLASQTSMLTMTLQTLASMNEGLADSLANPLDRDKCRTLAADERQLAWRLEILSQAAQDSDTLTSDAELFPPPTWKLMEEDVSSVVATAAATAASAAVAPTAEGAAGAAVSHAVQTSTGADDASPAPSPRFPTSSPHQLSPTRPELHKSATASNRGAASVKIAHNQIVSTEPPESHAVSAAPTTSTTARRRGAEQRSPVPVIRNRHPQPPNPPDSPEQNWSPGQGDQSPPRSGRRGRRSAANSQDSSVSDIIASPKAQTASQQQHQQHQQRRKRFAQQQEGNTEAGSSHLDLDQPAAKRGRRQGSSGEPSSGSSIGPLLPSRKRGPAVLPSQELSPADLRTTPSSPPSWLPVCSTNPRQRRSPRRGGSVPSAAQVSGPGAAAAASAATSSSPAAAKRSRILNLPPPSPAEVAIDRPQTVGSAFGAAAVGTRRAVSLPVCVAFSVRHFEHPPHVQCNARTVGQAALREIEEADSSEENGGAAAAAAFIQGATISSGEEWNESHDLGATAVHAKKRLVTDTGDERVGSSPAAAAEAETEVTASPVSLASAHGLSPPQFLPPELEPPTHSPLQSQDEEGEGGASPVRPQGSHRATVPAEIGGDESHGSQDSVEANIVAYDDDNDASTAATQIPRLSPQARTLVAAAVADVGSTDEPPTRSQRRVHFSATEESMGAPSPHFSRPGRPARVANKPAVSNEDNANSLPPLVDCSAPTEETAAGPSSPEGSSGEAAAADEGVTVQRSRSMGDLIGAEGLSSPSTSFLLGSPA